MLAMHRTDVLRIKQNRSKLIDVVLIFLAETVYIVTRYRYYKFNTENTHAIVDG